MSQRLGMADGRCFTIGSASTLLNNYIMNQNSIKYEDNYAYRRLLQAKGPEALRDLQGMQQTGPDVVTRNSLNQCQSCDTPLLNMSHIY